MIHTAGPHDANLFSRIHREDSTAGGKAGESTWGTDGES